jgi:hypothetical protein
MNKELILTRLEQLTGTLKAPSRSAGADLKALQHKLAQQLIQNPETTITGSWLHHAAAQETSLAADSTARFAHLDDLFARAASIEPAPVAPLIFRRETAFRSDLLGSSVPAWGTGLAPSESFGPFLDEHGLPVWFDFFFSVRSVKVYFKGQTTPVLLLPIWGSIVARKSYKIEPGSVWIASGLIARTSALSGYYTGLKVLGGTLEFSENVEVSSGQLVINPNVSVRLNLDLDTNVVTGASTEAGFDATEAIVALSRTLALQFNASHSTVTGGAASATLFGCATDFTFANKPPIWIDFLSQILVPYKVTAHSDSPEQFEVASSNSKLCTLTGSAKVNTNSGWLLPAAKLDPAHLGEAAGTGSLCLGLLKGLDATWKGLKGTTHLNLPAIIAQPGLVSVIDFFAANAEGKQKWKLWQNAGSKHHSEITLRFGKLFPFLFVTASQGSEAVICFCSHKASFDRPVDANGSPFKIESSIALAALFQTGKKFRTLLLDNDLLFDGNPNKVDAYKRYSLALRNALFGVSAPYSLFLSGELKGDNEITKGVVTLMYGIYQYLPTLPDPYVASYTQFLGDREANQFVGLRMALAGFVKWPDPAEIEQGGEAADDPAYVYFKFAPLNQSALNQSADQVSQPQVVTRTFQAGVGTFNQEIASSSATVKPTLSLISAQDSFSSDVIKPPVLSSTNFRERVSNAFQADEIKPVIRELEANSLLSHLKDKTGQVEQILNAAVSTSEQPANANERTAMMAVGGGRGPFPSDNFILLDVSSNADQMGVSLGTAIVVDHNQHGEANLRPVDATFSLAASNTSDFPSDLQHGRRLRRAACGGHPAANILGTILNIPLPIRRTSARWLHAARGYDSR